MLELSPHGRPRHARRPALSVLWTAVLLVAGTLFALNLAPPLAHAASATVDRPAAAAPANTAVTTFKNDNERDGDFSNETTLNESNVNVSQFGKRVQYPVDGQVYAEPLFLPNLTVNGATHNVVFVATENDSVYAFDADATSAIAPLWHASLLPAGATAVSSSVSGCGDLTPEIGITGTPVIDPSTDTMFVVSYDTEGGNQVYRLHALNLLTGADKWPPIVLSATVPGTGVGSSGGNISFNPNTNRQRVALMLENGKVYVGFSSFCDIAAYHGWILAYSYSTTAFTLANAYADTPNGSDGGLWSGSGGAIAGDPSGNVYYISGNGTFDANTGGPDYGDSFVRMNGSLQVQDYFTPYNQLCLSQGDVDLGAGGPLVLPSQNVVISAGKEGRPYVVNTTNMGKYTADPNLVCGGTDSSVTTIDKVQQELPPGTVGSLFSTPTIWTSSTGAQDVYFTQSNGPTRAFTLSGGKLSTAATSSSSGNGGDPVVSSNGTTAGTGIVWDQDYGGELHALNPTNLAVEYWNSGMDSSRDGLPGEVKYATPTVANGEVFVGLPAGLAIFGLLGTSPPPPPPTPTGLAATAGNASVALAWTASSGATSYNIYRGTTSGGEGTTPVATTASTSYTDTGLTNGTKYYYKVSATNGGGTSAQSSEASATPSSSSPTSVQISAGGPATGTWAADEDFTGGATSATTNAISTTGVTNPAPQSVYQHNRYGNFTYTIPGAIPGDTYRIRLHFAEEYWTTAGSRIFNVSIDGTPVLTNFDIFATAGGEYKAVVEQFSEVAPSNGTFTIQFSTVKDNAQVNGIEILSSSTPAPPPTPTGLAAIAGNASMILNWTASPGATSYNIYCGTTSGGEGTTPVGTSTTNSFTVTGLTNGTTYYCTVSATNSAGTSAQSSEVSGTPTTGSPPPPSSLQISAGGPATGTWVADEDFTGGATAAVTNAISTTGVTNPAPQSVYQHNRYGNFTYAIPGFTAGTSYTIRLHFAEEYWTTAGSRVFNVSIDGTPVLTNFDIFAAAGGEYKAVVEQFTEVAPTNGTFTIQFSTVKDNAQVNGIEILSG
jgi:fibronectin type 3 domain-containing protein